MQEPAWHGAGDCMGTPHTGDGSFEKSLKNDLTAEALDRLIRSFDEELSMPDDARHGEL